MFKCGVRLALCVSAVLLFSLYLLESHLQDICDQYRAGAYLAQYLNLQSSEQPSAIDVSSAAPGDKVIVMAKLEEEYTGWVDEELSEYVYAHKLAWECPFSRE